MTADDLVERVGQRVHIESTDQMDGSRNIVYLALGLVLIEEPQALLRKRQWQRRGARNRRYRRGDLLCFGCCGGRAGRLYSCDKCRHGGRFEDRAYRKLDTKFGMYPGNQLRCEQGMAAELEEVIVDLDGRPSEQLLPYPDHYLTRTSHR